METLIIGILAAQLAVLGGIFMQLGRVLEIAAALKERVTKLERWKEDYHAKTV